MPSAVLIEDSIVLTKAGWSILKFLDNSKYNVIGVDRHGRPSERSVHVTNCDRKETQVFIGCERSFGFFSGDSVLISSKGENSKCKDIVDAINIDSLYFDTVSDMKEDLINPENLEQILANMKAKSLATGDHTFLLNRRNRDEQIDECNEFLKIITCGNRSCCHIDISNFITLLSNDWINTIDLIMRIWLLNNDGKVEIERDSPLLGLWLISAWSRMEIEYSVEYDTFQHTSSINIQNIPARTGSFSQGRCALYTPFESQSYKIQWDDHTWNPVINGYLIGSSA